MLNLTYKTSRKDKQNKIFVALVIQRFFKHIPKALSINEKLTN